MKVAPLSLNRLEFTEVYVETNEEFSAKNQNYAPQLDFNFRGAMFRTGSSLAFQNDELEDPKNFALNFELALEKKDQEKGFCPPYYFRFSVQAFLTLEKNVFDQTVEVFRAVRQTGYSMIYGAMREMLANITSRSSHGMLQLPTAQFQQQAKEEAEKDEARRIARLEKARTKGSDQSLALDTSAPATEKRRKLRSKAKSAETVKAKDES
ncbi:hypothetical protein [Ralstonia pseudosolanacearum]|uniref:hypothetical protein n=1 Tax=Ralstonia pseudosolanacearum TaxID=1310165 RepID=UPI003CF5985A